ncbi:MAG: nucleotidyltransferase family protein [Deltaproteobacteria bacterium]|nr:nucleotidyltransferase family protein [Deltaproteobacteria bacterium]
MINRPTAGIVLAAGMSTRLGRPKHLVKVGGKTLLARVVAAALESELSEVVLVLGHQAERVLAALGPLGCHERLQTVVNERYEDGMAGSLTAGLLTVKEQYPAVMFLLGDQPLIDAGAINLLLGRFWSSGKDICVPVQGERRGNPVCFSRRFYEQIIGVQGDTGAREIIHRHPEDVLWVEIAGPSFFLDIDRAEDLESILALLNF